MKKILILSILIIFCTIVFSTSISFAATSDLDEFLGGYSGIYTYGDSNAIMDLKVFKNSSGKHVATIITSTGTYSLDVSYNSNTKKYELSGTKASGTSSTNSLYLNGTLSGNIYSGNMVANDKSSYNFTLNKILDTTPYEKLETMGKYTVTAQKDLNGDGLDETISIEYTRSSYDIEVLSLGKKYTLNGNVSGPGLDLKFADFDTSDKLTQFYFSEFMSGDSSHDIFSFNGDKITKDMTIGGDLRSYNGKEGKIITSYNYFYGSSFLYSYYDFHSKSLKFIPCDQIKNKEIQFSCDLLLFKDKNAYSSIVGMPGAPVYKQNNIYTTLEKPVTSSDFESLKIISIIPANTKLKITDCDTNWPPKIKIETLDSNKYQGWLNLGFGD